MKKDEVYLRHIYDAVRDIADFTSGVSVEDFLENKEKQYAVLKALEVIGEAAKNVSPAFRAKNPEIPLKEAAAMRDKLIHDYMGVKLEIVWHTVKIELPKLKKSIAAALKEKKRS